MVRKEQTLVNANRELVECFEKKIQATIARVWRKDDSANVEKQILVKLFVHRRYYP